MDQPIGAFAAVLGISQLLYISVVLALGVRLMLLAIRTRQLPEALLSTAAIAGTLLLVAFVGIGVAGSYWVTFFPTRAYIRFVERPTGVAAG
jgi:hypothetical protein